MPEPEPEPVPGPRRSTGGLPQVARIVGGVVVVGVVVVVGLVAERLTDDELTLPDRLAGLDADDSKNAQLQYDYNSEEFSDALDGAEAVTRSYGSGGGDLHITVTAVRAETGPPLPVSFQEPEVAGTAEPRIELVDEDGVTCLITRQFAPQAEGAPNEDDDPLEAVQCQRSGNDLTVRVFAFSEPEVDEIVEVTNDVWEELT